MKWPRGFRSPTSHRGKYAVEHQARLSVRALSEDPAVLEAGMAEMAEWLSALPSDAKVVLVCADRRRYSQYHYWQATWYRRAIETDEVVA